MSKTTTFNTSKIFASAALALAVGFGSAAAVAGGCSGSDGYHAKKSKQRADIVDTAVSAGQFSTLAAALQAAGLVDTLKGDGPFTVFAPTDDAFAKLPEGTVESLLLPENRDKLTAILTYHVVPGKVYSKQVVDLDEATTVNGQDVRINFDGQTVMIDDATVLTADVKASNGVIHIIDSVILPN